MNQQPLHFLERTPKEMPADGTEKPPVIFLLHGRAAEARTIFTIEGLLNPKFHVIAVQAPFPSEIAQFEWFKPTEDRLSDDVDHASRYQHAEDLLTAQIQSMIAERSVDPEKLYLLGFSQGAAMSYLLSLRGVLRPKGVVPMSGFLPGVIRSWPTINTEPRFLITHGTQDEVLGTEYSTEAQSYLQSKGIDAEYYEYRGRHKMSMECIRHVNGWLETDLIRA